MEVNTNPSARFLKGEASGVSAEWDRLHNIPFDLAADDATIAIQEKGGATYRPYYGDILIPADFAEDVKMPATELKPAPRFWETGIVK